MTKEAKEADGSTCFTHPTATAHQPRPKAMHLRKLGVIIYYPDVDKLRGRLSNARPGVFGIKLNAMKFNVETQGMRAAKGKRG